MIFLVSHNRYAEPYPVYPLGMAHVATRLRESGIASEVSDRIVDTDDEIIARVARTQPRLVGISIRNLHSFQEEHQYDSVNDLRAFVARLRAVTEAPIVLGGSAVNMFPMEITSFAQADYGIVEDAEALVELYQCLVEGAPVGDVPNLFVKARGTAPLVVRRPITLQSATDLLPRRYVDYYYKYGGMLNVLTRRGCPFRCSFCTYPMIEGAQARVRDADRVVQEVERLVDAGVHYFFFVDSVFNANLKHSAEVAQALIDRGLPVEWACYMTPRPFPPGYPELLKKAGLRHIEFGTDAFSDHMLKVFHKPFRFHEVVKATRQMDAAGVYQSHFLILGGAGETEESLDETLERSRQIPCQAFIYCNGVTVYRGTELYDTLVKAKRLSGEEDVLNPLLVFGDGFTPERIDARVADHERTHNAWVTREKSSRHKAIIDRIRARGRIKGPLWELLNAESPMAASAPVHASAPSIEAGPGLGTKQTPMEVTSLADIHSRPGDSPP